jgi:hypothetical protein
VWMMALSLDCARVSFSLLIGKWEHSQFSCAVAQWVITARSARQIQLCDSTKVWSQHKFGRESYQSTTASRMVMRVKGPFAPDLLSLGRFPNPQSGPILAITICPQDCFRTPSSFYPYLLLFYRFTYTYCPIDHQRRTTDPYH